jgi:hypothetical protein
MPSSREPTAGEYFSDLYANWGVRRAPPVQRAFD